jgi:hypothetical protein
MFVTELRGDAQSSGVIFKRLIRFTEPAVLFSCQKLHFTSVAEESRGTRPGNLSFHVFRGPGYFLATYPC